MSRIELAPEIADEFDRIFDHFAARRVADAPMHIREIIQAIDVLEHHPLIGRPVEGGRRELVMGKPGRGYVALYRYLPGLDTVFVLAMRSQREAGYSRP
jgi:toxin ParE1/3/4